MALNIKLCCFVSHFYLHFLCSSGVEYRWNGTQQTHPATERRIETLDAMTTTSTLQVKFIYRMIYTHNTSASIAPTQVRTRHGKQQRSRACQQPAHEGNRDKFTRARHGRSRFGRFDARRPVRAGWHRSVGAAAAGEHPRGAREQPRLLPPGTGPSPGPGPPAWPDHPPPQRPQRRRRR